MIAPLLLVMRLPQFQVRFAHSERSDRDDDLGGLDVADGYDHDVEQLVQHGSCQHFDHAVDVAAFADDVDHVVPDAVLGVALDEAPEPLLQSLDVDQCFVRVTLCACCDFCFYCCSFSYLVF